METIKHSIEHYDADTGIGVTWLAMPRDSQGDSAGGAYAKVYVATGGTFGGASVLMEGSWDGKDWAPMHIPPLTAPGTFEMLGEASTPKFMRPRVTGGDATTRITVSGVFNTFGTPDAGALR